MKDENNESKKEWKNFSYFNPDTIQNIVSFPHTYQQFSRNPSFSKILIAQAKVIMPKHKWAKVNKLEV